MFCTVYVVICLHKCMKLIGHQFELHIMVEWVLCEAWIMIFAK